MTDTLNKTRQSSAEYWTPETDEAKFWSDYHGHYVVFADRAGDFEHERDVDRSIVDTQREHISLLKKQREEAEAIARQCERVSDIYEQRMLEAEAANLKLERERDEAIKMLEEIKADALEIQFIKYGYDGCCGSTHIAALIERKCEETINRIKKQES